MSERISLNSSDHFQLLFDYKLKHEKGTANTSQMLIHLDSAVQVDELHDYLMANEHFVKLINAKLKRPLIGTEYYYFGTNAEIKILEVHTDEIVYNEVFQHDDIGTVPLKLTLIQLPDSSAILLQINHVFIDNNGMKNLLCSFNGEEFDFSREQQEKQASFFNRLKSTFSVARKMLVKWYEPKAFLHSESKKPIRKGYTIKTYSIDETERLYSKIHKSHHISSLSSVLLSYCCLGLKDVLVSRKEKPREYVFQQPYDLTPRKEKPYILGNRFSFIHYRLAPDEVSDADALQDELNRQTAHQMREKIPQKFMELESVLRHVHLRFHLWMISLPAKGKMTSFAYTFVGETKVIDTFMGRKVKDIINIPPVMRKPPITFGFGLYEGKLRFHMCYDSETISEDEIKLFFDRINELILS